jgi:hypothetical protein
MWLRRLCRGALLGALLVACGERAGDPVIRLASDSADAGGPGNNDEPASSGGSAPVQTPIEGGPIGLFGS